MTDVQRDIGRHDEAIENLKVEVHAMREDVSEIKTMLAEAKGGYKALMAVAGLSATLGAMLVGLLGKLLPWWGKGS